MAKKRKEYEERLDQCYIWLEYDPNYGKIVLHYEGKKYQYLNFQTESQNEKVFRYIYNHPRRTIKKSELNEQQDIQLSDAFSSIIPKMGFTGEFRQMFFQLTKSTVYFRREVLLKEVEKLHPDFPKLISQIKKLKEIS
ncbi:MAG: hypothetical protein JXI43_10315 [Tissierellales bacterium]|nr:hypothetical protein [Tissierellales bacterium]